MLSPLAGLIGLSRAGSAILAGLVIALAAGFALFRLKWGIIPVIGAGALLGLARALM